MRIFQPTITGSFTVITGSSVEFEVTNTGVKIGSAVTDIHSITGSVNISGSLNATASFSLTASYALNAGSSGTSAGGISQGKVVAIATGNSNLF